MPEISYFSHQISHDKIVWMEIAIAPPEATAILPDNMLPCFRRIVPYDENGNPILRNKEGDENVH